MAAAHLAYPDLAEDQFSGFDPDQDVESIVQLIERKINFAHGDSPANAEQLATTIFARKHCYLPYLEVQLPNGMKAMWKLLPHGKISERTSLIDLQMEEINSVIDWKLNTV